MSSKKQVDLLKKKVSRLKEENKKLKKENEYLKTHPTIAKGIRGELLILKLTKGKMTSYAKEYDLELKDGTKIEVKYSKLHYPSKLTNRTMRWTWNKPLGYLDKGKKYNYLLLIGDYDERHKDQYLEVSPYVFFLIPKKEVKKIMVSGSAVGANINLTSDFKRVRSQAGKIIISYMINSKEIEKIGKKTI